jgi:hypothetical protein
VNTTTYVLNSLAWAAGGWYAGWIQHKLICIEKMILKWKRGRNGDDSDPAEEPEA